MEPTINTLLDTTPLVGDSNMAVSLNIDTNNGKLNQKKPFTLEGVVYNISVHFNSRKEDDDLTRGGSWYAGLYDKDDNPILTGVRLLPSKLVFVQSARTDIFSGQVICIDTEPNSTYEKLDLDNFGQNKRFQLWYLTLSEMTTLSNTYS